MAAKNKAKKNSGVKKASAVKVSAKKPTLKAKAVSSPKKIKAPAAAKSKVVPKGEQKLAAKSDEKSAEKLATQKRKAQANAAMEEALKESPAASQGEEEEFDPAAFFAASGGEGNFRAHVMRKERVDLNLIIRYRFLKGPLVFNAELLNLSKGGLCLKTESVIKAKTVIRIEIPLPHTSELFAVQAEVIWSETVSNAEVEKGKEKPVHTGLHFLAMSIAKQAVINQFIQQRRDEVIMAKIGLDKFTDSVPVAGLD